MSRAGRAEKTVVSVAALKNVMGRAGKFAKDSFRLQVPDGNPRPVRSLVSVDDAEARVRSLVLADERRVVDPSSIFYQGAGSDSLVVLAEDLATLKYWRRLITEGQPNQGNPWETFATAEGKLRGLLWNNDTQTLSSTAPGKAWGLEIKSKVLRSSLPSIGGPTGTIRLRPGDLPTDLQTLVQSLPMREAEYLSPMHRHQQTIAGVRFQLQIFAGLKTSGEIRNTLESSDWKCEGLTWSTRLLLEEVAENA